MEEQEEILAEVITIGCCAFCENRRKLKKELCDECYKAFKDFGPDGWRSAFGHIMRQCRKNPALAKLVYNGMKKESAKEAFAHKFGVDV